MMMYGSFSSRILALQARPRIQPEFSFTGPPRERYPLKSSLAIETLTQSVRRAINGGRSRRMRRPSSAPCTHHSLVNTSRARQK